MSGTARTRPGPGWWFAAVLAALFLVGLVGWLFQGAGDDVPVPTIVPTSSTVPVPATTGAS